MKTVHTVKSNLLSPMNQNPSFSKKSLVKKVYKIYQKIPIAHN